ncbi:hypothetical protein D9M71_713240 [compost metagenome]
MQAQRRATAAQAFLGNCGAEIAARRITANRQAAGIDTPLRTVFCHPVERCKGIGAAGRQIVLRRQAIAHGNDDTVGRQSNAAADAIGCVQIADDEAAAKKPHERRQQLLSMVRFEDAYRDCATGPVDHFLGHRAHRRVAPQSKRRQSPALA